MLLLLIGSGTVGRDAIIERFLNSHPDWRFVSVDDQEEVFLELPEEEQDDPEKGIVAVDTREFFVTTILQCTQKLQEQNLHIIAACDDLPEHLFTLMRSTLGNNLLIIHIGGVHSVEKGKEELYDHFIDTKTTSVKDAQIQLSKLIQTP
ncbi:hypothetical protein A3D11_01930 [Candidatus Peribacteria bacterium RIFCSPHIGHO2_02_FULL_49_16]|nr:MAG: hypothetical protein A2880_01040 [Candidatus Peribacteria bacterium RIFCSPHIGHO2_01_FULL_49_38]OGJ58675.1 MAG: hypothetical protein A3D11_01930 [Candidatus Peribacteria bacterium RIFCSPHIGHO2_02_FULL_49_16]